MLGSAGTLCFDFCIFGQFLYYGTDLPAGSFCTSSMMLGIFMKLHRHHLPFSRFELLSPLGEELDNPTERDALLKKEFGFACCIH